MQWASEFLQSNWLYSSCDDDVIVNTFNIFTYLKLFSRSNYITSSNDVIKRPRYEDLPIICFYSYQSRDKPSRDPSSKWFISKDLYPHPYWPPHCRGGLYVIPVAMTSQLYEVSRRTTFLHLDDVWITGLMRRKLGLGDRNIVAAPLSTRSDQELMTSSTNDINDEMLIHLWGNIDGKPVDVTKMIREKWNLLTTKRTFCNN